MTAIKLFIGFLIIFGIIVFISIKNALEVKKCPECGEDMICYYNRETNTYEYGCESCGYKERI